MPIDDGEFIPQESNDDSGDIRPGDNVLLCIDNDGGFANILCEVAHEHGYKVLIAPRGATCVSLKALDYKPSAITLDIKLPDIEGWRVLSRLKNDPVTRHIPVFIISTEEDDGRGLRMGAAKVINKPFKTRESLGEVFTAIQAFAQEPPAKVIVAHPDENERRKLVEILDGAGVEVGEVGTVAAIVEAAQEPRVGAIAIASDLPDGDLVSVCDAMRRDPKLAAIPLIAYLPGEATEAGEEQLRNLSQTTILVDARSPERLLDATTLYLHRPLASLPESQQTTLRELHEDSSVLADKRVLIVDDDIRNIFAMTSILEPHQMQTYSAENGRDAIDTLKENPDIDIVLMDIMMPDMDGYETMRTIRRLSRFRSLPIIALTAKAMKGDREKCIEAGASDYISKPVDTEQLISVLRSWLYR